MKNKSECKHFNYLANAIVMVGIIVGTSGCSTVTTGQTDHCVEQANNADVHGVNTANEQLQACLETYKLRRDKERTVGEAFAEDVLISVLDIITD
ncbi:DNA ligase [Alteromonas sp. PRIM-21]|uniref:DNA ligase n=1 Tax=Alteromonas sp. PRIM-21 TaxID=1454978 RepID=UPI0022B9608D|nr:DNA ligase [Alteromonas sp. PRIM-21]MCZ8529520.1 DNA ligase [Alteromonas sp. PRIM-21]